ncbi:alpha/beta hydrolase [uncultured Robinsoniella sp.]|uniref:alpha/beta hydrolase n=1 Tax=Robinsoniella sp. TaxID=2496533 RepID=UPI00374E9F80
MKEQKNIELLEQAVKEHAFIRNISRHRNVDGLLDFDGNLRIWNKGMEPFEKMKLWEVTPGFDDRDPRQEEPCLIFVPVEEKEVKDTIIVCHGGGFRWRTGCEGPNVALEFHKRGYNTAILSYRIDPYSRMDCLKDLQRAIRLLRSKKEELHISNRIIVMGFSAGGMLCANSATHFDEGKENDEDFVERFSARPDAAVIAYGAMTGVSFPLPFGMEPDFEHDMMGKSKEERYYLAPEKNVTPQTPPMFIWQTLSDDGRFGMCLAKELQDAGVPYELHIMEGGVHGLGIADGENDLAVKAPHIRHWVELCDEWLEIHKYCRGTDKAASKEIK